MMESLSYWGRWGPEDELGALNLITPETRIRAAAEVRDGISVSLAATLDPALRDPFGKFSHSMHPSTFSPGSYIATDEYRFRYHGFTQTHLDALSHFSYQGRLYNGVPRNLVTPTGARKLSILAMKDGVFTRAVLMDMPRLEGKDFLDRSRVIYPEDFEAWEMQTGVRVEKGDALLIRTGAWTRRRLQGEWDYMRDSSGLDASCLPWIREREVALVGSDFGLDAMPSTVKNFNLPVNVVLIVGMGMPVIDNLDLSELSEVASSKNRWSFLLTLAPLPVDGGTGSPVNPIATF